jgi:hypothetical protein
MENMNDIVNELVADIDIPEDVPVAYEVWAVGYDEDGTVDTSEMYITAFADPDEAVTYAKGLTAADILVFAEESPVGSEAYVDIEGIIIEVETTVLDENNDSVNVGTVYRNKLELFEEVPDFVCLSNTDYEVIEETGNIQIPWAVLKDYNKNDIITVLFTDEEKPWPIEYKIISKTTAGYYICEFV